LKDSDGRACELRVTPYRTSDNRIDGVVLSVLTPDESSNILEPTPDGGSRSAHKKAGAKNKKNNKKKKLAKQK
jgi:hypothetical protein